MNMTEEQKNLLMRDLCARLPYGVVIQDKCLVHDDSFLPNKEDDTLIDIDVYSGILMTNGGSFYEVDEMKPYLFPLSSMTEEQKEEHKDLLDNQYLSFDANGNLFTLQDFYCKYHLDYRGFIPDGLAEDATGKNIY
jgi:hypothetical protein